MKIAAAMLMVIMVSACSLFTEAQPGLTEFKVAPDGSLEWLSGKEFANIRGCYVNPNGTRGYIEASDVKAFEGQQILLAMQAQQLEFIGSLVDRLAGAAGPMLAPRDVAEPLPVPPDPCVALFASGGALSPAAYRNAGF